MRIACVLITHLRAKAELRRHAHLRDSQIAVVDRASGKPLVVDSSAGASARAGMTLEQAMFQPQRFHYTRCGRAALPARVRGCHRGAASGRRPRRTRRTRHSIRAHRRAGASVWKRGEGSGCAARRRSRLAQRSRRSGRLEIYFFRRSSHSQTTGDFRLFGKRSRVSRSPVHRAFAVIRGLEEVAAKFRRPHDGQSSLPFPRQAG